MQNVSVYQYNIESAAGYQKQKLSGLRVTLYTGTTKYYPRCRCVN